MSYLSRIAACFLFLGLVAAGLAATPVSTGYFEAIKSDAAPVIGQEYYLRHGLKFEGDEWNTTNYWRGTFLPINTKVKLVALDAKDMVLRVTGTGEAVKVKNVLKYSRVDLATIAARMLSPKPISLEKFDRPTKAAIESGILTLGMTREQVVMTRGYPPGHETPSLDLNRWKYWSNRFVTQTIEFSNDVLTRGRGLE